MRVRARRASLTIAAATLAGLLALAATAPAGARQRRPSANPRGAGSYQPPPGKAFHGVSGTVGRYREFQQFRHRVQAHPAVLEDFFPWGTALTTGALQLWDRTSTRGML